jgi:hypothetical protein
MSKSSDAVFGKVFGEFFHASMRNAAPILFCCSLVLFVITIASNLEFIFRDENDFTDQRTRVSFLIGILTLALNNAVLPFAGAAIVWAVNMRAEGGAA